MEAVFAPIWYSQDIVAVVVEAGGGFQQVFKVEAAHDVVVVEQDDVFEAEPAHGFFDGPGHPFVVDLIEIIEYFVGWDPVDGFCDGVRIEVPHVFFDGYDAIFVAFDDADTFFYFFFLGVFEEGDSIQGIVHVEDAVVFAEFECNVFAVAANFCVPGL